MGVNFIYFIRILLSRIASACELDCFPYKYHTTPELIVQLTDFKNQLKSVKSFFTRFLEEKNTKTLYN